MKIQGLKINKKNVFWEYMYPILSAIFHSSLRNFPVINLEIVAQGLKVRCEICEFLDILWSTG
jgi:hypothetical protein